MEPDVVEISPPLSKNLMSKKAVIQEVIDVEQYELQNNNNGVNKNKGKAIQFGTLSYNEQFPAGSASYGTLDNNESYHGSSPVSNSLLDPDSLIYEDDYDYPDQYKYYDNMMEEEEEEEETDDYSKYQELFDGKDIPTDVEVTMDWFENSIGKETAKTSGNNQSFLATHEIQTEATGSEVQSQFIFSNTATQFIPPWFGSEVQNQYNNSQVVAAPSSSASALQQQSHYMPYYPPHLKDFFNHLQPHPQIPDTTMWENHVPAPVPFGLSPHVHKTPLGSKGFASSRARAEKVISAPDPSRVKRNVEDYLGTYLFFKRFDIVEDFSDHQYASFGSTTKQYTKDWAKRIQEEWRILENDLPDMIFVRAYESRMDLLRAVIIGAEGTPYHDGLFFFDIFFPDTYPSVPPSVNYHSGGLRINPNLYNSGKVCLSLLGTWSGSQKEKWIPNNSTMLQVLVSIQGLILNKKPYFNEPGHERTEGSPMGESSSKAYSENTFLLSLKTMVYSMRRPPKYFEDFAYGHFFSCAHDIVKACNAYRNGAPVGSLVKGGVQDVEESSESSSKKFRSDVAIFVDTVLDKEFILLGVLGLEGEEINKTSEANNVAAESSSRNKPSSKRDRVSSH
ncbi:unnamed protein product [Cochlearia groenlandica]